MIATSWPALTQSADTIMTPSLRMHSNISGWGNCSGTLCSESLECFSHYHSTVWGVEPVMTHQTSWLESTGVCGLRQNQAGGSSVQKRSFIPTHSVSQSEVVPLKHVFSPGLHVLSVQSPCIA